MCRYDGFPCAAFREHKRLTGQPYLFPTPGGVRGRTIIEDRTRVAPFKLARFFIWDGLDEVTACALRGGCRACHCGREVMGTAPIRGRLGCFQLRAFDDHRLSKVTIDLVWALGEQRKLPSLPLSSFGGPSSDRAMWFTPR